MAKIMEKHVNRKLNSFMEAEHCFHSSKSGFRRRDITESTLLGVTEHLRRLLDRSVRAALILLNFSAVFDTVS